VGSSIYDDLLLLEYEESVSDMSSVSGLPIKKDCNADNPDELRSEKAVQHLEEHKAPSGEPVVEETKATHGNLEGLSLLRKYTGNLNHMTEIAEQVEEEESNANSPTTKRVLHKNIPDSEPLPESDSAEESDQEEDKYQIDEKEYNRTFALKLDRPFYEGNTNIKIDIERTASFGDWQDLFKAMPSFAKFGLITNKLKKQAESSSQQEAKQDNLSAHEVGPEYLKIDPENNLPAGFFYLAKEDES